MAKHLRRSGFGALAEADDKWQKTGQLHGLIRHWAFVIHSSFVILSFVISSATAATDWIDGLATRRGGWQAAGGGTCRVTDGLLEVQGAATETWTRVELGHPPTPGYDMRLELQWTPLPGRPAGDGFELAVWPHSFGSAGYCLVAQQEPWRAAQCRGPKLAPGIWHSIEIQVRERMVAYRLADRLVAQSPVAGAPAQDAALRVAPGVKVAVRRLLMRSENGGEGKADTASGIRFVYGGAEYGCRGNAVQDPAAAGGQAAEVSGAPAGRPLVWGQDASLPGAGAYVALFGLRGMDGAGPVRLEAAPAGGGAVSARTVRFEELPRDVYEAVPVAFRYDGTGPMEYRIRAERGRLRLDQVVVVAAEPHGEPLSGAITGARPRRALPLAQAWGKAPREGADSPFAVLQLSRRWHDDGWFEFTAGWRVGSREPVRDVAVDVWVACRDAGGGVTTFDYGEAQDWVEPGEHQVAVWLDPAECRRAGGPVALFVQVYRNGVPVAAGWRKWGVPVDDKYIVEARRIGSLRPASPHSLRNAVNPESQIPNAK